MSGAATYRRAPGVRPLTEIMAENRKRADWIVEQRKTRTLQSIADELGITRERVRQIEVRAQRQAERESRAEAKALKARGGQSLH